MLTRWLLSGIRYVKAKSLEFNAAIASSTVLALVSACTLSTILAIEVQVSSGRGDTSVLLPQLISAKRLNTRLREALVCIG